MPNLSSIPPDNIAALMKIRAQGRSVKLAQVTQFRWPQPVGTKYYTCAPYDRMTDKLADEVASFSGVVAAMSADPLRFETRLTQTSGSTEGFSAYISDLSFNVDVEDSKISIDLANGDGGIEAAYLATGGFGTPVEIFYYFPQVDLLISRWFGYLDPVVSASNPICRLTASRSTSTASLSTSTQQLPGAAFYPLCPKDFPFEYPELFLNADGTVNHAAIALNDCDYDPAAGQGVYETGTTPFQTCDRTSGPGGCAGRFPGTTTPLSLISPYGGFDNIQQNDGLPFRQDSRTIDQSRGNSDNLAEPIRVIFGRRVVKDQDVVQTVIQVSKVPENGSDTCITIPCEGPIVDISNVQFNNLPVTGEQLRVRLGETHQTSTDAVPAVHTTNYSSRAVISAVQKGDFRGAAASSISIRADIKGLRNIRVYTDETNYSLAYSTNPAWCALEGFRNRRWGLGVDLSRMYMPDWLEIASWFQDTVSTLDAAGDHITGPRADFNAEWRGRKAQDQIRDWALYRRVTLPFPFEGKLRVRPLTAEVLDQDVPVFTDRFKDALTGAPLNTFRNILPGADGISSCDYQEIGIDEQINELVIKFDDGQLDDMAERPLLFRDLTAQKAAGHRAGDNSLLRIKKEHFLTGIIGISEAIRQGNILLDLGEFDEGGLKNPIRITFNCSLMDALTLHPYKVIKVDSYKLDRMVAKWGFTYFRILKMEQSGVVIKVTAQAYPENYYADLENLTVPLARPGGSVPNPNGGGGGGFGGGTGPNGRVKPLKIDNPTDDDFGIFFILREQDIPEDLGY